MDTINSYLQQLVVRAGSELRLEPNQIPFVTTSEGKTQVSTVPMQGGQISMMMFPLIPSDLRRELPTRNEVEFQFSNAIGNFDFRITKSPSGFIVSVTTLKGDFSPANRSSAIPLFTDSSPVEYILERKPESNVSQTYTPIETPAQTYRPIETPLQAYKPTETPLPSYTPIETETPLIQPNTFAQPPKVEDVPVISNENYENSDSLNYYLRKLKENRGVEIVLTPNKEAILVTANDRIAVTVKPLLETRILLLIEPLVPFEAKKLLSETNHAKFIHGNQFGKFLIKLDQTNTGLCVGIKFAPPEETIEIVEQVDESKFLGANTSGAVAFNANARQQMDEFFHKMANMGASDLHLSATMIPLVRKDGRMLSLSKEFSAVSAEKMKELLYSIMPDKNIEEFERRKDTDFAYEIKGLARFRANIFMDRKGPGGVFRVIPSEILTAQKLGLSSAILDLCNLSKGLVVVTGPTGSGKSTTLCAMVDHINKEREDHIITIEDPIEFVHDNKKCLINQREVHNHTDSFKDALRAALREDPDIVLVGEMRDLETIAIAIETAETGHLVFGTLHTSTAASTIDRIIDQFPADRQQQIRIMLSESLRGVIAQTLLPKKGGGRIAALEVLIVTPAVSNLIREGKTFQIPSAMQTGKQHGMVMLNDALFELVQKGLVEPKDAYIKAVDKPGFEMILNRNGIQM
jgi:twitching motility protein PilT